MALPHFARIVTEFIAAKSGLTYRKASGCPIPADDIGGALPVWAPRHAQSMACAKAE